MQDGFPQNVKRFYDSQGIQITRQTNPALFADGTAFYRADAMRILHQAAETIRFDSLPEPEWLKGAKLDALRFAGSIGLQSAATIHYLDSEHFGGEHRESAFAAAFADSNSIFLYSKKITELFDISGQEGVTRTIIHEIGHSSMFWLYDPVYHKHDTPNNSFMNYRTGLIVTKKGEYRGFFLNEARAEYLSGLYDPLTKSVRTYTNESSASTEIPSRYTFGKVNGPDGYSFELIAKYLEQQKILDQPEFTQILVDMSDPDKCTKALRTLPKVLNAVEPDLYKKLQAVKHSGPAFKTAYAYVHHLVNR